MIRSLATSDTLRPPVDNQAGVYRIQPAPSTGWQAGIPASGTLVPPAAGAIRHKTRRGRRGVTAQCTLLCKARLAIDWNFGSTTGSCQNQNFVQHPALAHPAVGHTL